MRAVAAFWRAGCYPGQGDGVWTQQRRSWTLLEAFEAGERGSHGRG